MNRAKGRRRRTRAQPEPVVATLPIWEQLALAMQGLPAEALDTLPEDLAEQHDHYPYGAPRR